MRRCARRALVCSELPSGVRSTAASATNRRRTTSSSVNVTSSGRSTSATRARPHRRIFRRGRCPGVHRVSENPGGSRLMNPLRSPGLHYRIAAARDRITELRVGAGGYTPRENRRSRPAASRTKPRSTDLRRRGVTLQLRRKLVDAFARSRSGQRALRCVRRSASRPVAVPESLLMGSWRTGRVSGSAWWRQRP